MCHSSLDLHGTRRRNVSFITPPLSFYFPSVRDFRLYSVQLSTRYNSVYVMAGRKQNRRTRLVDTRVSSGEYHTQTGCPTGYKQYRQRQKIDV